MLRISFLYLIYKRYNHVDRTVFIEDSFACKCLFPQTDLIELKCYLVHLVAEADIAFIAFRQNKQTPLPFKAALLDLRLAFKGKIFDLPRLITTWKPVRRCLSLHFYLPFDSWFYCSCSVSQPMKTRVETDYPRGPRCPFRRTKQRGLWERDCLWSFSSPEPLGLICNRPVALDATENTNFFIGWRQLNAQSKLKI